jgi:hypothetical protein
LEEGFEEPFDDPLPGFVEVVRRPIRLSHSDRGYPRRGKGSTQGSVSGEMEWWSVGMGRMDGWMDGDLVSSVAIAPNADRIMAGQNHREPDHDRVRMILSRHDSVLMIATLCVLRALCARLFVRLFLTQRTQRPQSQTARWKALPRGMVVMRSFWN